MICGPFLLRSDSSSKEVRLADSLYISGKVYYDQDDYQMLLDFEASRR